MKVFEYYKTVGILEVTITTRPDTQPNHPILTNLWMYKHSDPHLQLWRDEPVSVNDCFLKNIHNYKYIANIDNDEIIMSNHSDWIELISELEDTTDPQVEKKT